MKACNYETAIVVFDAGSTDGSVEWVRDFARQSDIKVEVLIPEEGADTSFSGGINAATKYAAEKFPQLEYYFFFETDNFIASSDPIRKGIRLLDTVGYLAATGFTVTKHSGAKAGIGCSFPTVQQLVLGQHVTCLLHLDQPIRNQWWQDQDIVWTTCDAVFTSPLLARRTAWEKSEGLDARQFPFSDCDVDWAWRLAKLGWKIAVIQAEGVVHDNREALSQWSAQRVIHFHRARMKLLNRHVGSKVAAAKPLLFIRHAMEYVLLRLLNLAGRAGKEKIELRSQLMRTVFNDYK